MPRLTKGASTPRQGIRQITNHHDCTTNPNKATFGSCIKREDDLLNSSGFNLMSYVYLLCFGQPIGNPNSRHGQATHYLGFTSKSLKQRLEQHRSGAGARITRAAVLDYGRELKLVRHWRNGTRTLERELKRRHNPKHYCPYCNNR
jgi:putative endonuclease